MICMYTCTNAHTHKINKMHKVTMFFKDMRLKAVRLNQRKLKSNKKTFKIKTNEPLFDLNLKFFYL